MPELPEVETTVRGLRQVLVGKTIQDAWTDWPKMVRRPSFPLFKKKIIGKKVTTVGRRGKNILITLSDGEVLLAHMKMTGHFLYGPYKKQKNTWTPDVTEGPLLDPYNRFIHLVFYLSDGKHLAFSDMRKFGKVLFLEKDKKEAHKGLKDLGPEPLEKKFTVQTFKECLLRRPSGKIKTVLLDQTIIAGIGNIYSDEMLWETALHPETRVKELRDKNFQTLYKSMKKILTKSIKIQGDSKSDYRNIYGQKGGFQNFHKAYGRKNLPCLKKGCDGTIRRIVVGSRSAHFCDKHQKLKAKNPAN
jgi:formamidopyrimidine-DNA glycosylase